jgi:hypothetical protein
VPGNPYRKIDCPEIAERSEIATISSLSYSPSEQILIRSVTLFFIEVLASL